MATSKSKDILEDNSKDDFDPIWCFIEKNLMKDSVPDYIKYVLSYYGYNNATSIASIDDDDISYCVKEVRNGNVTDYYESKKGKKNVLEGCRKNHENFEFVRGHLKYLIDIVETLKKYIEENGANCINEEPAKLSKKPVNKKPKDKKPTAPKKKMKYSAKNNSLILESYHKKQGLAKINDETPMEKHLRVLANKMLGSLRTHTPALYSRIAKNINKKIKELIVVEEDNVKKLIETNSNKSENKDSVEENAEGLTEKGFEEITEQNGDELAKEESKKYRANMLCQYCWTPINVFWVVTGSPRWNSSNFDRHLKLAHCDQEIETIEVNSENEDVNVISIARSGVKSQVFRGGDKIQDDRDGVADDMMDGQDVDVVSKIQKPRDSNKSQVDRRSNKSQNANISNESQGTKDQAADGGKKMMKVKLV